MLTDSFSMIVTRSFVRIPKAALLLNGADVGLLLKACSDVLLSLVAPAQQSMIGLRIRKPTICVSDQV